MTAGRGGRGPGALRAHLAAMAEAYALAHPERLDRWAERLEMNRPERDGFAAAPSPADAEPYLSPPRTVLTAAHAPPSEPPAAGLARLAVAVADGTTDPRGHVEDRLSVIRGGASLNVFTSIDADGARRSAEALRSRVKAGLPVGRLAGAVLAVKDLVAVRGLPMTGGTLALDPVIPAESAPAVARLVAEDAIVVGLTNLHELAYGITSDNPHFGRVGNPRRPGRIAGGSSGGSAAAIAAGMADLAVGTDTAGSIRIPAACCGVVGLKPSYDAVPREGVLALAWSLDHVGPLAASVADAALAFEVMAGLPPGAVTAQAAAWPGRTARLARPSGYFFDLLEPSVAAAVEAAFERLTAAGFTVAPTDIEGIDLAPAIQFMTICPEATQGHLEGALRRPEGLGEDVRVRLEIGQFLRGVDYVKAQRLRSRLAEAMMRALGEAAVLVVPTLLAGAPPASAASVPVAGAELPVHTAMTRCTAPFNLTGFPALTLPCGTDRDGLPVGLQVVGRPGEDAVVLGVAAAIEAVLAGRGGDRRC